MKLKDKHPSIYTQWRFIRRSCYDPKHPDYKEHQKTDSVVCRKWGKFKPFLEWWQRTAKDLPEDDSELRVSRIDPLVEYNPSNCKLVQKTTRTKRAQKLTYKGKSMTVKEWSEETGIKQGTIYSRWKQGLPPRVIFGVKAKEEITYRGVTQSIKLWASKVGISESTIRSRISNGWSAKKALTTAPRARRPAYFLEFDGQKRSLADWSAVTGIPQSTITYRLGSGWSVKDSLTTKP